MAPAKKERDSSRVTRITTPSPYGSHASMVVRELDELRVLCKDDYGEYETFKSRLDTGIADPNRFSGRTLNEKEIET